ncbi:hypothetical protein GCM10025862_40040 [Arsenicicoccus piscis]|uniref:Urease subunit gamma n=1 Tax=Arsenicicoccus piscis TaxID=673954 RepID=A0ABQ6HWB4_9MICO|nr:hypothetical protein GCM10025862_40040 [Arsenicicoccus piscis]
MAPSLHVTPSQHRGPSLRVMHLSTSDTEKLLLAVAGMVARDRLARGVRLNHPESIALLSTWVIEEPATAARSPS